MAKEMELDIDNQGKVDKVRDAKGNDIPGQKEGPQGKNIIGVETIVIVKTNPMCWIYSGGRWFQVPC